MDHFMKICLREISLEGLDGLTMATLWRRLECISSQFAIALTRDAKEYVWNGVLDHDYIKIYRLPRPRPDEELFILEETLDNESGYFTVPKESVYDFYPIRNEHDRGSCPFYESRVDISVLVRQNKLTLENMESEEYDRRVVLVAPQHYRERLLLGNNIETTDDLSQMLPQHYSYLERVARGRYNGELAVLRPNLRKFFKDSKTLWYIQKILLNHGLLVARELQVKPEKGHMQHVKIFFTPANFRPVLTCMQLQSHMLFDFLRKQPNQMHLVMFVKKVLGHTKKTLKNLMFTYSDIFEITKLPLGAIFSHLSTEEAFNIVKSCADETNVGRQPAAKRMFNVVRCKGPPPKLQVESASVKVDDGEEEDEYGAGEEDADSYSPYPLMNLDQPILKQIYCHLLSVENPSQKAIGTSFALPRQEVKNISKLIAQMPDVSLYADEKGKNKVTHFHFTGNDTHKDIPLGAFIAKETSIIHNQFSTNATPGARKCITQRKQKRIDMVLQTIEKQNVIGVVDLRKMITDHESAENLPGQMDRKSMIRILDQLEKDNLIKIVTITINEKPHKLVCNPMIDEGHEDIAKAKELMTFSVPKTVNPPTTKTIKSEIFESEECIMEDDCSQLPQYNDEAPHPDLRCKYNSKISTRYGYLPRHKRRQILHEYLWYIIYHLPRHSRPIEPSEYFLPNEPPVFVDESSWKRYVGPLLPYKDLRLRAAAGKDAIPSGWCVLYDAMCKMPLAVLLSLIQIPHEIELIMEILRHPQRRFYPIMHLPEPLMKYFLGNRTFMQRLSQMVESLSCIGLVTCLGVSTQVVRRRMVLFLHRKAALVDTRESPPAELFVDTTLNYPTMMFDFNNEEELCRYWHFAINICLNTKLVLGTPAAEGESSNHMTPKEMDRIRKKLVRRVRSIGEVKDDGSIPCERMGAAGWDASELGFRPTSWHSSEMQIKNSGQSAPLANLAGLFRHNIFSTDVPEIRLKSDNPFLRPARKRRREMKRMAEEMKAGPTVPKKPAKTVPEKKKQQDEVDAKIYENRKRLRSKWSRQEDFVLLMCKVASFVLTDVWKREKFCVSLRVIRDVLHSEVPEISSDKTSLACGRRIYFIINYKPHIFTNFRVFATLAMARKNIVDKFRIGKEEWSKMYKEDRPGAEKMFQELSKLLIEIFRGHEEYGVLLPLPNNKEELKKNYEILQLTTMKSDPQKFPDVTNGRDICVFSLYNYILGCFVNVPDETHTPEAQQMRTLFHQVLRQYDKPAVKQIFDFLHNNSIITKVKGEQNLKSAFQLKITQRYKLFILSDLYVYTRHFEEAISILNLIVQSGGRHRLNDQSPCVGGTVAMTISSVVAGQAKMLNEFSPYNIELKPSDKPDQIFAGQVASRSDVLESRLGIEKVGGRRTDGEMVMSLGPVTLDVNNEAVEAEVALCREAFQPVLSELLSSFNPVMAENANCTKYSIDLDEADDEDSLPKFIHSGGPSGKTRDELMEEFPDTERLKSALSQLLDDGQVMVMGLTSTRFVHKKHVRPWLIRSYSSIREVKKRRMKDSSEFVSPSKRTRRSDSLSAQEMVDWTPDASAINHDESGQPITLGDTCYFLPEPWHLPNGRVVKDTLITLLQKLCVFLMKRPGISMAEVVRTYSPFHPPRTIRRTVSALIRIGCVRQSEIVHEDKKPGLFTKRVSVIEKEASCLSLDEDLFLIPSFNCITRLGRFIEALKGKEECVSVM